MAQAPHGPLRQGPRGLLLHVRATPKARHDAIEKRAALPDGSQALAVKVTAIAEGGKANAAIIALMAKTMGVSKSSFVQIAGETDRHKIFRIGANADVITRWLADLA